jgi:hypothetical protein
MCSGRVFYIALCSCSSSRACDLGWHSYCYCKSKIHEIEQCWRWSSHRKGDLSTLFGARGYTWPTGRAGLARSELDRARAFGDVALHDTKMKRVVPCWPAGPEAKPVHDPVAFKRVLSGRRPDGPYCVEPTQSPDIRSMFIPPINLVILTKKLFNITKFELKI